MREWEELLKEGCSLCLQLCLNNLNNLDREGEYWMKIITISLRDLLSNKEVRIKWRSFYTCNSILTSCQSTKCLMIGMWWVFFFWLMKMRSLNQAGNAYRKLKVHPITSWVEKNDSCSRYRSQPLLVSLGLVHDRHACASSSFDIDIKDPRHSHTS